MVLNAALTTEVLEALRQLDTCMVSNAIETFDIRLRNAGFANRSIRCMLKDLPPLVGYAATARLSSAEAPISGRFRVRTDWWNYILQMPAPRIIVLEDLDHPSGVGAFLGEVHASILQALGCVGYVTNGAVRELPAIRKTGLNVFAGNVAVSHAYAHIFDFGATVTIGGLEVRPGCLLHGDRHGLLTVPQEIAAQIPATAERLRGQEQKIIDLCNSGEFSVDKLRRVIEELG